MRIWFWTRPGGARRGGDSSVLAPRPCAKLVTSGRYLAMVSQQNPIRIFVSHLWEADDDYLRVFEFLESARNFYYANTSKPDRRPPGGKEAEREELRAQIAPAEAVVVLASQHRRAPELIEFEANFAKAAEK